jgi:hypothetical protein
MKKNEKSMHFFHTHTHTGKDLTPYKLIILFSDCSELITLLYLQNQLSHVTIFTVEVTRLFLFVTPTQFLGRFQFLSGSSLCIFEKRKIILAAHNPQNSVSYPLFFESIFPAIFQKVLFNCDSLLIFEHNVRHLRLFWWKKNK